MQAHNRPLPEWFNRIRTGQLRLPRFQRFEAWGPSQIAALLEAVLRGLPSGALLILEVGGREQFVSRPLLGAPEPSEKCTEHLLDGQQRLTALWRAFHNDYEDRTYLVYYAGEEEEESTGLPCVHGIARWEKGKTRYPLWVDDPIEVRARGYFPLHLIRPHCGLAEVKDWCGAACPDDLKAKDRLEEQIVDLQKQAIAYNLPFLRLDSNKPADVALDVFIKMNTSTVSLSDFDVIVAQFEAQTGESLHQLVENLRGSVPELVEYDSPQDVVLNVAALRSDRAPTRANYFKIDLDWMADEWERLVAGVRWAVRCLQDENVWDSQRLPTVAVLPVLAALHDVVPEKLDSAGNARIVARKYMWRAFLTRRYENTAATRSLQDLRGLKKIMEEAADSSMAPIFKEDEYPLPTAEELARAGWPKKRDILARGLLAITIKNGAFDIADAERATSDHVKQREYHHLFPDSLLTNDGRLDAAQSYRALNCALITWNTNRTVGSKEPIAYLRERAEKSTLGEQIIRDRLSSHLVPFDELFVGGFSKFDEPDQRAQQISEAYDRFLTARALLFEEPIRALCDGMNWPYERSQSEDEVKTASVDGMD